MKYKELPATDKQLLWTYVSEELQYYSSMRDHKETISYTAFGLFLGLSAFLLVTTNLPDYVIENDVLVEIVYSSLSFLIFLFLRKQLAIRRWAALRISGLNWLRAEWISGNEGNNNMPKAKFVFKLLVFFPDLLSEKKKAFKGSLKVYPEEIALAWKKAEERDTDARFNERLVLLGLLLIYALVIIRIEFFGG